MKKEVREGYKMTELGEIPNEWNIIKLREVVTYHNAGIYKKKELFGEGTNIVGVSNLYNNNSIDGQIFKKVPLTEDELKEYTLQEGDLIYGDSSLVREGIGRTLYVTKKGEGTAFAWHTRRFKVNKTLIDSRFLNYILNYNKSIRKQIISLSTQTALTGITTDDFFSINILVPSLKEQKNIGNIISIVDEQIENTEKLIQKNQELKKGLMQQLLTKGIGHTEFKKTELGYIPKEWEIKKLKEISEVNPRKDILEDYKLVSFIGMEDIDSDGELINKKVREYVSVKKGYTAFRENDVLLAKITPCFENGKRFLARGLENKIGFGSTEFHVLRASEKINSCYLYYIINSYKFKTLAENNMIGSAGQKRVPTDFIKEYELIVPTKEEQEKIVSILSNIDKKVKQYKNKKYKLEILKKGLMQKLLTGAIKV